MGIALAKLKACWKGCSKESASTVEAETLKLPTQNASSEVTPVTSQASRDCLPRSSKRELVLAMSSSQSSESKSSPEPAKKPKKKRKKKKVVFSEDISRVSPKLSSPNISIVPRSTEHTSIEILASVSNATGSKKFDAAQNVDRKRKSTTLTVVSHPDYLVKEASNKFQAFQRADSAHNTKEGKEGGLQCVEFLHSGDTSRQLIESAAPAPSAQHVSNFADSDWTVVGSRRRGTNQEETLVKGSAGGPNVDQKAGRPLNNTYPVELGNAHNTKEGKEGGLQGVELLHSGDTSRQPIESAAPAPSAQHVSNFVDSGRTVVGSRRRGTNRKETLVRGSVGGLSVDQKAGRPLNNVCPVELGKANGSGRSSSNGFQNKPVKPNGSDCPPGFEGSCLQRPQASRSINLGEVLDTLSIPGNRRSAWERP